MAALPSGTVTFLFTAIEGSTTRREQHREQMQAALARHDRLLRQAIAAHGGRVFKTVGDAFSVTWGTERVWRSALRAWRAWWWRASQGGQRACSERRAELSRPGAPRCRRPIGLDTTAPWPPPALAWATKPSARPGRRVGQALPLEQAIAEAL